MSGSDCKPLPLEYDIDVQSTQPTYYTYFRMLYSLLRLLKLLYNYGTNYITKNCVAKKKCRNSKYILYIV